MPLPEIGRMVFQFVSTLRSFKLNKCIFSSIHFPVCCVFPATYVSCHFHPRPPAELFPLPPSPLQYIYPPISTHSLPDYSLCLRLRFPAFSSACLTLLQIGLPVLIIAIFDHNLLISDSCIWVQT